MSCTVVIFKDKDLKPENIRKGVKIFKVKGTLEGGGGQGTNQDLTEDSSTVLQEFTAGEGYDGIGTFTLNPYVLDTKALDPSTVSQTVTSSEDAMSSVTVSAVTSSIDSNIQAGNIKAGVSILGVTGNMTDADWVADAKKGTLADISSKTLPATGDSVQRVPYAYAYLLYKALTQTLPQITGNTAAEYEYESVFSYMNAGGSGVLLPEVSTGVYEYSIPLTTLGTQSFKSFMDHISLYNTGNNNIVFTNLTSVGANAMEKAFYQSSNITSVTFPALERLSNSGAFLEAFNSATPFGSVNFPELLEISSNSCFHQAFQYSSITDASFPKLQSVSGGNAFYNAFQSSGITSASFPALVNITGSNSFQNAFRYCYNLTSVSFPELLLISGSHVCDHMLSNSPNVTSISFPKLESINGSNACDNMLGEDISATSWDFPSLVSINGIAAFANGGNSHVTSVNFPELTTVTNGGLSWGLNNSPNLAYVNMPKLSTYSSGGGSDNTTFGNSLCTTVIMHPNALSNSSQYYNILGGATNVTNLTISADATDNIYLNWHPNLTAASVLSVLSHLDLNTSGKSVTFDSGGLTVTDDAQGSIQTAYDAASNAGWTINNLTIIPA